MLYRILVLVTTSAVLLATPALAQHHGMHDPQDQTGMHGHDQGQMHQGQMADHMSTMMDHMSELMQQMHGLQDQMTRHDHGTMNQAHGMDPAAGGQLHGMTEAMSGDLNEILPHMNSMLETMRRHMSEDGQAMREHPEYMQGLMDDLGGMLRSCRQVMDTIASQPPSNEHTGDTQPQDPIR